MNEDYAHVMRDSVLDYGRLGLGLKAVIAARRVTLQIVQHETGLSRATVSRATTGHKITTAALLRLCIWADLNPFETLRPMDALVTAEGVFHGNTAVKLSEIKREFFEGATDG
ncbi:helix-turn-helix domain-containing protein [Roseibium sediminis]|uniref:helix-turn-helix domain-containing protein n=1 Tax=Roseibium sediminis TaxID=1775174 RepID=UPI00123CCFA2|nr:helix-turn-helix transcriptional regulator [Roseibium sediminis]